MSLDVTVTTASIPGRELLLAEAIQSVCSQTIAPRAHLVRVQRPPNGLSPWHLASQRNALLQGVQTTWTSVLDDDDLYLPNHFEMISEALGSDADVVYTFAREGNVAREDVTGWASRRLYERLLEGNCISSNSTIRTSTLRRMGGWAMYVDARTGRFSSGATWEDWDMWLRLAQDGAKFVCVPEETWDYRHGDWERCTG